MIPLLLAVLSGLARPCGAVASLPPVEGLPAEAPPAAVLPWLVHPTASGMRVVLPIVDTDPNSGTSAGVMPVWIVLSGSATIRQIHVVSLTYNDNFGVSGSYQYFYFTKKDTNVLARVGMSQRFDREAVGEYTSDRFLDRDVRVGGRLEFTKDSSRRFYGIGPAAPKDAESNYTMDTINYRVAAGVPLSEGSPFTATLTHQLQADDLSNGGVESVRDLRAVHPATADELETRRHDLSLRGSLEYDTRDNPTAPVRGADGVAYLEGAHKDALSEYDYYRYGGELKSFHPFYADGDPEPFTVSAVRVRFESLQGSVPFWLLPQLGGKYSHRAYGEGRFVDHSSIVFGGEQRIRLYSTGVSGTNASFWLDPFFALGAVAPSPDAFQRKYLRPVVGTALRVVSRPNVVGSADFGVGQEGLKVFLDINYTF